jgi:hypothetical protein
LAIEGFTCLIIFKNIFSFALTFKAFDWLITNGDAATPVFNALGTVQLVACLLTIPMCKRSRRVFEHASGTCMMLTLRQTFMASDCAASSTATTCSPCVGCAKGTVWLFVVLFPFLVSFLS